MKKNNKGFSLVEIIIAIVILALVITPFLNSFLTSATTNQKAKRIMRATSVAENIMEAIKPLGLEEIVLQLSNDGNPSHMPTCNLVPIFESHKELLIEENEPQPGELAANAAAYVNGEWQFYGQESDIYYFSLTGIELDSEKYDARIKLDASEYYAQTGEMTPGYNDQEMVQISGLDLSKDVLYELEIPDENKVYAEFAERSSRYASNAAEAKDAADFKGALTRQISVEVKQSGILKEVHLTLTYTAPVGWVAEGEREYSRSMQLFSGEELRNIYVLYPPNYNSMAGSVKDIFVVKNYNKIECGVYLVKQVTGAASDLLSKESFYVPKVELYEAVTIAEDLNAPVTNIFSNYTVNLGKREMGSADYSMADPTQYVYNSQTGDQAKSLLVMKDVLDKQSEVRIFKAEVRIYEAGAFDSSTGSFDESKHIATLSN